MNGRRRAAVVAGWLVMGVVLTGLVAALLVAAVASARTGDTVGTLARQLDAANHQLASLRADNEAQQRRSEKAARQRQQALDQNRDLQRQLAALAEFLRRHGFDIPSALDAPALTASPSPAAPATPPSSTRSTPAPPRPHRTAGPPPTRPPAPSPAPTPRPTPAPTPFDPLCGLGICLN